MTHRACRSRARTGHLTATGPVTPTRSRDRWGRAETQRTALGEALVIRRRTRVRFPPPPPRGLGEMPGPLLAKKGRWLPRTAVATGLRRIWVWLHAQAGLGMRGSPGSVGAVRGGPV